MEKKKNGLVWVLILTIVVLLGAVLYLCKDKIFNKTVAPTPEKDAPVVQPTTERNEQTNQNSEGEEETNQGANDNVVTITDFEVAKPYYAIIAPTEDVTVYQTKKITASNLTNEFIILNTIKYENQTDNSEMATVNAENLKKYAEVLFGKTISSLPKTVVQLNSSVNADYTLKNGEYILNSVYGEYYSYSLPGLDTILFQKLEKADGYIYIYDAVILNASFGESGCGYISKPDKTGEVAIGEGDTCKWKIEDLYKQYPDYFSKYKHTFKGTDYNVTYISSEPIK